ncbi:MAG TPA: hypothetical protein VF403_09805 [Kofleriaceae bacterium]
MTLRAATAFGLAAIVALAAWQHWRVLGADPFPIGVDGYFYPIQVRSILEHGVLRYPASPVTFYWMAPFAAVTDPIVGAKLGAAIGMALIAVPAYGVGAKLGGSRAAGAIAAVVAATSADAGYLAIEFVKQGIGLTVALGALWVVLHTLDKPSYRRVAAAIAAVALAFATHKLAGAIVVVVAMPSIVVRTRHLLHGRRLIYAALAGVAIVLALIVLGIAAPQRFVSPHDLSLLGNLFSSDTRWSAPALVMQNSTLAFGHEAAIGGVLAIVAAVILASNRHRHISDVENAAVPDARVVAPRRDQAPELRAFAWVVVGVALVIAIPWLDVTDPQGLGFRLRVTAFVPMALCAAICAGELLHYAKHELVLVAIAAAILLVQLRRDRTEGEVLTHPALAAAVMAATDQLPTGKTVIVPERHIMFMVDWYTRADVSLRPEPIPYAQRVRLFGLVFIGGAKSPLDVALDAARDQPDPPIGLHPRYRNGLVLVSEPTWDWLLAQLPAADRAHFAAWPTI